MADNNLNININTKADKSEVVDLSDAIKTLKVDVEATSNSMEGLSNSANDINGDGLTDVSDGAGSASDSLSDASSSAEDVAHTVEGIDGSSLEDVSDAAAGASGSLGDAGSSADEIQVNISNIDPSVIEQLADAARNASDEMGNFNDNTQDTGDSMSMMDALASTALSGAVTGGFMSASAAAGNYSDTMVRLGYAMSGTSMSAEEAEATYGSMISSMTEQTGRGAGSARSHLINLGNAGIKNSQILQDSFLGISKAAFQMGGDMDSMEQKFQAMVLSGNAGSRQLKQFGMSAKDLAAVMGVSTEEVSDAFKKMSEEERANVLATALNMKYGEEVNKNYQGSYEHLMDTLQRAKDYFIRVAGEALLPVLIPAIESAANIINFFAKSFRSLPAPIKSVIGGLGGLMAGATAAGLAMSGVLKIVNGAAAPFIKLFNLLTGKNIQGLGQVASALGRIGKSALEAGLKALKTVGMWIAHNTVLAAQKIAAAASAAAQWLLNVAMDANPIMIIILAIIALIAALTWLYFNNEQVRQAIDALGQAFIVAGQFIWNGIIWAIQQVSLAFQGFYQFLLTIRQIIIASITSTVTYIIMRLLSFIVWFATLPSKISAALTNIIVRAITFAANFVGRIIHAGSQAVSGFMNYISSLPGKLATELQNMLSAVGEWAATLPAKFWEAGVNAVKNFLSALGIASPGTMQRMIVWEVTEMGKRVPVLGQMLISNLKSLGENAVKSFGTPKLNNIEMGDVKGGALDFSNTKLEDSLSKLENSENKTINITLNVGSVDKQERIDEIIDTLNNYFNWNNTTAGRTV